MEIDFPPDGTHSHTVLVIGHRFLVAVQEVGVVILLRCRPNTARAVGSKLRDRKVDSERCGRDALSIKVKDIGKAIRVLGLRGDAHRIVEWLDQHRAPV